MIEDIKKDAKARMKKSIESLKQDLIKVRTGRAHTSLLEHIMVPYYGSDVPISQVANLSVSDSRTITVTPWEKPMIQAVEKAIMTSDLGLTPNSAGNVIRVPLPALTEERRKDLIKVVRNEAENARIAVRNIRRDANSDFKQLVKEKEMTEDDERKAQEDIQKLTDSSVKEIDELLAKKEEELMEI